jgi:hypothetical protein
MGRAGTERVKEFAGTGERAGDRGRTRWDATLGEWDFGCRGAGD